MVAKSLKAAEAQATTITVTQYCVYLKCDWLAQHADRAASQKSAHARTRFLNNLNKQDWQSNVSFVKTLC